MPPRRSRPRESAATPERKSRRCRLSSGGSNGISSVNSTIVGCSPPRPIASTPSSSSVSATRVLLDAPGQRVVREEQVTDERQRHAEHEKAQREDVPVPSEHEANRDRAEQHVRDRIGRGDDRVEPTLGDPHVSTT
jgi:hypothetical protein